MTPSRTPTDAVAGSTVADVMHTSFAALPATATVRDARAWFAGSASRRLALITDDDGHYLGSLTLADIAGDVAANEPAEQFSQHARTLSPSQTAAAGRDELLATDVRRVAVVDHDGRLVGVLALTRDAQRFSCA